MLSPGDTWRCLQTLAVVTSWRGGEWGLHYWDLVAETRGVLNIPQCTGRPPSPPVKNYPLRGSPAGPVVKNSPVKAQDMGAIPSRGRSHVPQSNQAHGPQLLKPTHPRARALQQEKPPRWGARAPEPEELPWCEARAPGPERSPCLSQLETACTATKAQHSQKNKIKYKLRKGPWFLRGLIAPELEGFT